jgi:hypothetical protein
VSVADRLEEGPEIGKRARPVMFLILQGFLFDSAAQASLEWWAAPRRRTPIL